MTPEKLQQYQQYIDFINTNLQPLAKHLKVSVEWLWTILVNQVRVEAIVYLVIILMLTAKSIILLTIAYKSFKKAKFSKGYGSTVTTYQHKKSGDEIEHLTDDWENRDKYKMVKKDNTTNLHGYLVYFCGIGGAFLMITSVIMGALLMPKIVTGLVNPQYGAIEKIVEFSQGKVPSQYKDGAAK